MDDRRIIIVLAATFLLDQFLKLVAQRFNATYGAFGFVYVENTGAVFGAFQGWNVVLAAVGVAATTGIWWFRNEFENPVATGLLLGGAASNTFDRFVYGHVVDYAQIGWWPVFNAADTALCVGVAWLLYDEYF